MMTCRSEVASANTESNYNFQKITCHLSTLWPSEVCKNHKPTWMFLNVLWIGWQCILQFPNFAHVLGTATLQEEGKQQSQMKENRLFLTFYWQCVSERQGCGDGVLPLWGQGRGLRLHAVTYKHGCVHEQSHWTCLANVMSQSPMLAHSSSNNNKYSVCIHDVLWAVTPSNPHDTPTS